MTKFDVMDQARALYARGWRASDIYQIQTDYNLDDVEKDCYYEALRDVESDFEEPDENTDDLADNDFFDFLTNDKSIWEVFPGQAVES